MKLWPAWYRPELRKRPATDVIEFVAKRMHVLPSQICGKNRNQDFVNARHLLCVVFRERGLSAPMIGRLIGDKDHTTVLHACKNFPPRARRSPELEGLLNATRIFAAGGTA